MDHQDLIDRREFLKMATAMSLGALATGMPRSLYGSSDIELFDGTADAVILLWVAGGMAATETFDPKKFVPYQKGLDARKVLSTFPSIPTAVDDVFLSQGLESIAGVMDRGTLIRSFSPIDLRPASHPRHQFHFHTGYVPPQTVAVPHMGAWISRILGRKHPDLPPYIEIGQDLDRGDIEELKAFMTSGFLGADHSPLFIQYPEKAQDALLPPGGVSLSRFENRYKMLQKVADVSLAGRDVSSHQRESLMHAYESAYRLIKSPVSKVFNLQAEPEKSRQAYGGSRFGKGCLLARRLVEAGARFVTVSTNFIPFKLWDTHSQGHEKTAELKAEIDRPIAQLILDLEERGMLDRTIVLVASEFSRVAGISPNQNDKRHASVGKKDLLMKSEKAYGLHRHYTGAGSLAVFGGGFQRGLVYGETSSESPCDIVRDPMDVTALHATLYHALGIPPDAGFEVEERPFYITEDGKGKRVEKLLA